MPLHASRDLPTVCDDHGFARLARLGANSLNLLHNVHAIRDRPEDNMFAIQPARLHGAEEELGAVGVGPRVRHGEDAWARVLEGEVLIRKLVAVDGLAARAVATRKVPSLAHEVLDDAVEGATLEVQRLARLARALLAGAETAEVLSRLWHHVGPELHDDTACVRPADLHVEEHLRVDHCWCKTRSSKSSVAHHLCELRA
mmetsp:Transcript_68676/g.204355  ORF Transcript_68676/g.204355 Transcript_68676/m.204355 type:complete len:200 (+) Transcript_68676:146-745(+)